MTSTPDTLPLPRVLLTRPRAQAEETAVRLRREGMCVPVIAPLLEILPVVWRVPDGPPPRALLLTSANAAPALERFDPALPVFAVGERTGEEARRMGFSTVFSAAGGDAESLMALLRERWPPGLGPLLHLSGAEVRVDLAHVLARDGYVIRRQVVYRADRVPDWPEAQARTCALALLYSPRTASLFAEQMTTRNMTLVCLSDAIARAAGSGWTACHTAPHPSEEALLDLLTATLSGPQANTPTGRTDRGADYLNIPK